MNERDELADVLMSDELDNSGKFGRDYALAEADAILAAGYRKLTIDDATVERAARAMLAEMYEDPTLKVDDEDRKIIRAVLSAAVQEER